MMRKSVECPNCGKDLEHECLGSIPVEELVTDEVRQAQLDALRAGVEARHSVCIAVNAPIVAGGRVFGEGQQ